jgi:uncharacterized protein (DUF1015 family)
LQQIFALKKNQFISGMQIANTGAVMPPKSTWFEPKLRSGMFVHKLSQQS